MSGDVDVLIITGLVVVGGAKQSVSQLLRCENFQICLCFISVLSRVSLGFGPFGHIKQVIQQHHHCCLTLLCQLHAAFDLGELVNSD